MTSNCNLLKHTARIVLFGECKRHSLSACQNSSINGIDPLNGLVHRSQTRQLEFNQFKISDDGANTVTRTDFTVIGNCYGAMPGWGNYDSHIDFNLNYKIDIADLATVAANVQ